MIDVFVPAVYFFSHCCLFLLLQYPDLTIVRKESESELFLSLKEDPYGPKRGCGVGLTNLGTFQLYQRNINMNPDCSLTTQKRVVQNLPNGFATAVDTGIWCTSLVSYVINLYLNEMIADGFVGTAWEAHLNRVSTHQCPTDGVQKNSNSVDQQDETFSLSLADMAGIFVLHLAMIFLSVCFALEDLRKRSRLANATLPEDD